MTGDVLGGVTGVVARDLRVSCEVNGVKAARDNR